MLLVETVQLLIQSCVFNAVLRFILNEMLFPNGWCCFKGGPQCIALVLAIITALIVQSYQIAVPLFMNETDCESDRKKVGEVNCGQS